MASFKIGLLEFGYRTSVSAPASILNNIIDSAIKADQLGYHCYWLGEHHRGSKAWSSPEMLIPVLAGMTDKIKIGAAGILLSVHSPYRVALNFKLLANLFPKRIDLGLANGIPNIKYARMLLCDPELDLSFPKQYRPKVKELMRFFENDLKLYTEEDITIPPYNGYRPDIWRLSNSFNSFSDCLEHKMHYSRSLFHGYSGEEISKEKVVQFKKDYYQKYRIKPRINIVVAGICEQQQKAAQRTFDNLKVKGSEEHMHNCVIGPPQLFEEKCQELSEKFDIDEFVFYDMGYEQPKRSKAIEMIAEKMF
jgi:alkanesulfonate monooxygenase SsuD/methylene tetrahydromethanopterin reductase-like flavin-dependent oxidoreductase (luciferase family)